MKLLQLQKFSPEASGEFNLREKWNLHLLAFFLFYNRLLFPFPLNHNFTQHESLSEICLFVRLCRVACMEVEREAKEGKTEGNGGKRVAPERGKLYLPKHRNVGMYICASGIY